MPPKRIISSIPLLRVYRIVSKGAPGNSTIGVCQLTLGAESVSLTKSSMLNTNICIDLEWTKHWFLVLVSEFVVLSCCLIVLPLAEGFSFGLNLEATFSSASKRRIVFRWVLFRVARVLGSSGNSRVFIEFTADVEVVGWFNEAGGVLKKMNSCCLNQV